MSEFAVAIPILLLLLLLLWKLTCLILRAKRSHYMASLDPIDDALLLCKLTTFVEFSFLANKSYEFALYRTFAIPPISKLSQSTHQFCPNSITKRYDDTVILIQESSFSFRNFFCITSTAAGALSPFDASISFMPSSTSPMPIFYMPSLYSCWSPSDLRPSKSSTVFFFGCVISVRRFMGVNGGFVYRYGYRNWTEGEKQAQFVVWHDIGTRMGIKDIPKSLEEMEKFNRQYEAQQMVYSDSNRVIGDATLDLFLSKTPSFLRPLARRAAFALCDNRLLDAMGYPRQPYWLIWIVESIVGFCGGTFVRWFMPPRPMRWSTERIVVEKGDEAEGREEDESVYKVRYEVYKPWTYPGGYKISELGNGGRGQVGKAGKGELLRPLP